MCSRNAPVALDCIAKLCKLCLLQAHLLMEIDHANEARQHPEELMKKAQAVWVETAQNVRISHMHSEVSNLLNTMDVAHAVEHLTEGGLFSLDLAIPGKLLASS